MSGGLSFGMLPTFADLDPAQQAAVMQRLQSQFGGEQPAAPQTPGSLPSPADPPTTGAIPGQGGAPQVAMNETETRRLEEQMGMRLPNGGQQPAPDLARLFDPAAMGGGPNPFSGSADPYGQRNVPLPPQRPSGTDLLSVPTATGSVSGMNPGMPQAQQIASSKAVPGPLPNQHLPATPADRDAEPTGGPPLAGAFDPLTGQVTAGQPRPLGVPQGAVSPSGAAAATGASSGVGGGSIIEKFAQGAGAGNPELSNLLLHVGMGLMSKRGFGEGVSAGLQSYQNSQASSVKNLLEQVKLQQTLQGQQAIRQAFVGKGLSPAMVEAAALDPTVRSSVLAQMNQQPSVQEIDGKKYWLKPGDRPGQNNLIGDVTDKDPVHFDRDPVTGELTAYRTNQIFPDKGSSSAGGGGDRAVAGQAAGADASGVGRVLVPSNRGVRIYGQTDPRTGQIVQPPPNSPPGVSGYYDATGKPNTLDSSPETERDKAVGGAIGKDIAGYVEAGKPAREKMAALNILDDAWKAGKDKITTGPSADRVLSLKQFARGSLGLDIGDNIAPSELIAKIGTQLATADAKSLTARPTQFDFGTYLKNNPGLALSPEGNQALIDIKKQQAQHEIDLAALARDRKNWDNWDEVTAAYDKAHPIISPLTKRALGADEVNFPDPNGQRGDPGARYQQLMRSGMSKTDAFAQMHREGL